MQSERNKLKQETNNISDYSNVFGHSLSNVNGKQPGSDALMNNFASKEKHSYDPQNNMKQSFIKIIELNDRVNIHTIKDPMFTNMDTFKPRMTYKEVHPDTGFSYIAHNISYFICGRGKSKVFSNVRSLKALRYDIDAIVVLKKLIEFDFLRPFYITDSNCKKCSLQSNGSDGPLENEVKKGFFNYEVDLISKRNQKRNLFYISKIMNFMENQYVSNNKMLETQDV